MSRDQRMKDNWGLLYACEVAERSGSSVVVVFNLVCNCHTEYDLQALQPLHSSPLQARHRGMSHLRT